MDSQGAQDELAGRQKGQPVEISFDASVKAVSTNSELSANSELIPTGITILDNSMLFACDGSFTKQFSSLEAEIQTGLGS